MSWGEAHRLTLILLKDPSSQLGATVRGWQHPITRADAAFRDWVDMNTSKKSPLYPRPWHAEPKKIGGRGMSVEAFRAAMDHASQN